MRYVLPHSLIVGLTLEIFAVFFAFANAEEELGKTENVIQSKGRSSTSKVILQTRAFEVPINFLELTEEDRPNYEDPFLNDSPQVKGHLDHLGVTFGPGTKMILDYEKGVLTVTNEASQLEKIESIVSDLPALSFSDQKKFVSEIKWGPVVETEFFGVRPEVEEITKKLRKIRLRKLKFSDTPLDDALDVLQELSVESDTLEKRSHKKGVNFILSAGFTGPVAGCGGYGGAVETGSSLEYPKVSVDLHDISIEEALREILNDTGCRFTVEAHAVVVIPASIPPVELFTQKFFLPRKFYEKLTTTSEAPDPFAPPETADENLLESALELAGVSFPAGCGARYDQSAEELIVTTSREYLAMIQSYLSSLDGGRIVMGYKSRFHETH